MSVVGNVYAVELPDTNVRGFLAMLTNVMMSAGLVASVSLGLCLRWFEIPAVGVFLACFASVCFVPKSPTFLAVSGREAEAREVLRRLRGPSADVEEEMKVLKDYNRDKTGQPIFRLFLQRDVFRALLALQGLFLLQNFCVFNAFMINTTRIFQDAGASLDEMSSVLAFLVQTAGNVSAVGPGGASGCPHPLAVCHGRLPLRHGLLRLLRRTTGSRVGMPLPPPRPLLPDGADSRKGSSRFGRRVSCSVVALALAVVIFVSWLILLCLALASTLLILLRLMLFYCCFFMKFS